MEKAHRNRLSRRFRAPLRNARMIGLDIADISDFVEPA
jgi:predicted protein tyrosine phosphatase